MDEKDKEGRISFTSMADELIDMILSYELLDYRDLCRFAQVCVRFNILGTSQEVWKRRALRRWKIWRTQHQENWKQSFRNRLHVEKKMIELVERMAKKYYSKSDVPNKEFKDMITLIENQCVDYASYTECTLEELIHGDPRVLHLTHRHYGDRLYAYLRQHQLKKEWKALLALPAAEQNLEDGAVLIAKWMQYKKQFDIAEGVNTELDRMADLVRSIVDENEANSSQASSGCQYTWNPNRCLRILDAIKEVMFTQENFSGNSEDYYNINNSMIHEVLERKKGIPITLAIVFTAIAKRLGVQVEPVNFPNHFLLRWKSNQELEDDDSQAYTYIDCFSSGRFLSKAQCLEIGPLFAIMNPSDVTFPRASAKDVFTRMVANIINVFQNTDRMDSGLRCFRHALDLTILLNPDDYKNKFIQTRVFIHLGINLDEAIDTLQDLLASNITPSLSGRLDSLLQDALDRKDEQQNEEIRSVVPKLRSDPKHAEVKYKVGMVMRHRRFNYGCVVYGWDYFCDMSDAWIQQMGVDLLPNGRSQPFYNVLGDDGSTRYASQENIMEEPDQEFNPHPDLGKYFKAWRNNIYLPNEALQTRYPDD